MKCSAPKMGVTGVERIYGRAIEKVRYIEYYGYGDTKAFSAVAKVYGDEDKVKKTGMHWPHSKTCWQ